jgi:multidrug efflux pump subunit AcrA (membrane-fusion protein)
MLLFLSALGLGCREEDQAAPTIRPIRAMRIGDVPALTGRTFPGTAEAVEAVDLSFRVGGPLSAFPAKELGKKVSKGDLLAQIDTRDFEVRLSDAQAALAKAKSELDAMRKARPEEIEQLKAALARAEAAAQFARAEYNRFLTLRETKAASPSEIQLAEAKAKLSDAEVISAKEALRIGEEGARPEEIKAKESQIDSLQAAVQTAQDELSDTQLTAPFDGSVSAAYVNNFEVVQPKQRIVRLVNTSELEIRVDIPENLIALVPKVTEPFVVIQSYPDVKIPARIAEVGTEASATTRTYPVKLRFTPPEGVDVRPGMTGTVGGSGAAAAQSDSPGHVVPAAAVFNRDQKRMVWVYDPAAKAVKAREVTVLGTTPFGVNVSGVEPGEWVVTAGVHYLDENQTVHLPADKEGDGEV